MNHTKSVNNLEQISGLQPQGLWQCFASIASIPHTSYHEHALIAWLKHWAEQRGLQFLQDKVGNVLIRKPATEGMELCKGIILQAHLDMVGQKSEHSEHDFLREPIQLVLDGPWLRANDTTLGADNGIGMAAALAVLDSDELVHGPLEVLLTINEEAGMDGAQGLQADWLQGDYLINTDSEQEAEIFIACAGGGDTQVSFSGTLQPVSATHLQYEVQISGLRGGHSGCDIHTGRANANCLLANLLQHLQQACDFELLNIAGGSLRNAIPRQATAQLAIRAEQRGQLQQVLQHYQQQYTQDYAPIESGIKIELIELATKRAYAIEAELAKQFISAFASAPNGVHAMYAKMEGVVETSLNLGIVNTQISEQEGRVSIELSYLSRSLLDENRQQLERQLQLYFKDYGAQVLSQNDYPAWPPQEELELYRLLEQSYQALFAASPKPMAIHAGLECGLIQNAYPQLQLVSIGPTIKYPHSPEEKVDIASVERFWQWLIDILAKVPKK